MEPSQKRRPGTSPAVCRKPTAVQPTSPTSADLSVFDDQGDDMVTALTSRATPAAPCTSPIPARHTLGDTFRHPAQRTIASVPLSGDRLPAPLPHHLRRSPRSIPSRPGRPGACVPPTPRGHSPGQPAHTNPPRRTSGHPDTSTVSGIPDGCKRDAGACGWRTCTCDMDNPTSGSCRQPSVPRGAQGSLEPAGVAIGRALPATSLVRRS